MPDSLYELDALAWSEQQAELLRRLAAGERINDTPDWANIVEEIQDVGLSELHSVESLLVRAIEHLIKLHLEPASPSATHWSREIRTFLATANRRFSPSIRQRIDMASLYKDACYLAIDESSGSPNQHLPALCPFTLDDLLPPQSNPATLAARLATP